MMQWLGWLVALLAIAAAFWFVRAWRGELLCMLSPADLMDLRRSLGRRH